MRTIPESSRLVRAAHATKLTGLGMPDKPHRSIGGEDRSCGQVRLVSILHPCSILPADTGPAVSPADPGMDWSRCSSAADRCLHGVLIPVRPVRPARVCAHAIPAVHTWELARAQRCVATPFSCCRCRVAVECSQRPKGTRICKANRRKQLASRTVRSVATNSCRRPNSIDMRIARWHTALPRASM